METYQGKKMNVLFCSKKKHACINANCLRQLLAERTSVTIVNHLPSDFFLKPSDNKDLKHDSYLYVIFLLLYSCFLHNYCPASLCEEPPGPCQGCLCSRCLAAILYPWRQALSATTGSAATPGAVIHGAKPCWILLKVYFSLYTRVKCPSNLLTWLVQKDPVTSVPFCEQNGDPGASDSQCLCQNGKKP